MAVFLMSWSISKWTLFLSLLFFWGTVGAQNKCYMVDSSAASWSIPTHCYNCSNCSECGTNIDFYQINGGGHINRANLGILSSCQQSQCVFRLSRQVNTSIPLRLGQCPCSLYSSPDCLSNSSSCSALCSNPRSIRVDCDEMGSTEVIRRCIAEENCGYGLFGGGFCRFPDNFLLCSSFCALESDVPEACSQNFTSTCMMLLKGVIGGLFMEYENPKRLAKLLARYTREIELEESTTGIFNLVTFGDMTDYSTTDDYYATFQDIGSSLDAILDDSYGQWNSMSNRSASRVFSSIENILERIGNTLSQEDTNVTNYELIGRNTIFRSFRRRVCRGKKYFEFDSVDMATNKSLIPEASIRIPYEALCSQQCCSVVVSISQALNIADYITKYLVGDNTSEVSSVMLSATILQSGSSTRLEDFPLEIFFSANDVNQSEHHTVQCSFLNNITMRWSDEGVSTEILSDGRIKCTATHLTSFAVLVSVTGDLDGPSSEALHIVSYIGCAISIVSLIATLAVLVIMRKKLGKGVLLPVHFNFCLALLIALLVFVTGLQTAVNIPVLCTVVAAAIQYFFLCSFCWMLSEGIVLYFLVVKVFSSVQKKWYILIFFSWGLPIPIVAFSVAFLHADYGTPE